ncbi:HPP family protein [Desulfovibrio ferrophilus]|uniref:CBS domain containing protein n=1 Tax=Desulfovibrio ferrophilus TaxID=241368 RepID=A0A2Z6AZE7_9BACT|nr:CBS domain-containing protein [Desulfovibrio ferrophilus]BBD08560.1 CBS domain containing protein [Desulfovibrio ferrophilus]
MLMRKRAWDIMRDDYTRVEAGSGLVSLIQVLKDAVSEDADNHIAVVVDETGKYKGVITMWNVMRKLEQCVFSEDMLLKYSDGDWDRAFTRACKACSDKGVDDLLEDNVPSVQPNDPLVVVVESFLKHRRGWALVREGGKVLGVVFKSDIFKEVSRDVLAQLT